MKKVWWFWMAAMGLYAPQGQAGNTDLAWPAAIRETRPWTRWWWLGNAVDEAGLTFRMEEMHRAGIGGVEITPIYGTKGFENRFVDFLSPRWMDLLAFVLAEGKRLDMGVDLNTGTGWPFGGGPSITRERAASKVIFETFSVESGKPLSESVAVRDTRQRDGAALQCVMAFSDRGDTQRLTDRVSADGMLDWTVPDGKWKVIAVFCGKSGQKVKRAAPGGEGWVMDHFSAPVLDAYLDCFTRAFRESRCPAPDAFFNDSYEVYGADWTPALFDAFARRRGYRLEDHLPAFLGEGDPDAAARVRADYRETLSDLLLDEFTRPWTAWAHRMGSRTRNQAHGSPGNLLDLYAAADIPECESFGSSWFDIPGFRWDDREIRMNEANPVLMRFASSAAHTAGKPVVSSETFTWLTEHFQTGLSQCKPQLDEMFLAGVNRVFFHGTPYSPKDAPWPGWQFYASVNFSPYNTIWRDIEPFNQYIARCQSFLQADAPDNDVLVYWPVHDAWHGMKGNAFYPFSRPLEEWLVPTSFFETVQRLRRAGFGVDHASDRILLETRVDQGLVKTPGASYRVLVVPSCRVMPAETMGKLVSLVRAGATLAVVGALPGDVPGLGRLEQRRKELNAWIALLPFRPTPDSETVAPFGKGKIAAGRDVVNLIDRCGVPREIVAASGVQFIRRKRPDGNLYFLANLQSRKLDGWVTLGVRAASAALFDPLSGNIGLARLRQQDRKTMVFLQLESGESVFLKTWREKKVRGNPWMYFENAGRPLELTGPWDFSFIQGEPKIAEAYRLAVLGSWTDLGGNEAAAFAGTGKYAHAFILPDMQADGWRLDLGTVRESARVVLNGRPVGTLWALPFRRDVGPFLRKGENRIEVEVTNAPANRIADYERRKAEWKIFYDINIVNRGYKPFDASEWPPMLSGLIGPVTLTPLRFAR